MAEGGHRHPPKARHDAPDLHHLLARTADGDRDAFRRLYEQTSGKLFAICLRILTTREEAEEALQEVYVSVWRRAASYRPDRGEAMPWLVAFARNRAVDRLRARRPVASEPILLAETVADPMPSADERIAARQEAGALARCLDTLAAGDAVLIRTAFFQGASYSDLASRASTPLGTVKSRIRRALLRLRDCLQ